MRRSRGGRSGARTNRAADHSPRLSPPAELRQAHPSPPATLQAYGHRVDVADQRLPNVDQPPRDRRKAAKESASAVRPSRVAIAAAVGLAETLAGMGLRPARAGSFARPPGKSGKGLAPALVAYLEGGASTSS